MLQRRTFLKKLSDSSLYILTIGAFLNHPLKGWAKWNQEAFQAKEFQKSVKAIYGSTPIESTDQIKIEAPDVAENGLSVPVSVSSSIKQIENLSIFIENNPWALRDLSQRFIELINRKTVSYTHLTLPTSDLV